MLCEFKKDEDGRIRALDRLEVLDTPEERPFETIVTLVQQVLDVPMCAVSLVDRDRQWFKAKRGLSVDETSRDISFCTHAIKSDVPFIIHDAELDTCFASNPLVTGEPHIRSYAGIPLQTPDGYNIGTLCAIDTVPRKFPAHEISILSNFAKVIVDELELRQVASSDALSGALSRRAWMEKAATEITRSGRYRKPLSIMIMDIDNFKAVNDTYGHLVGDVVIKQLAQLALAQIRETDALGRFGGEEFVVLMPETALLDAMKLAERLRKCFSELEIHELNGAQCSVSIGVTEWANGETALDLMLERADKALYKAKNEGRNRCVSTSANGGGDGRLVA